MRTCAAAASSSPPPTTAPCSTATTGAFPNSMYWNARCQLAECSTPSAVLRSVSSVRSRPAEKCCPSPLSTTALMSLGSAVKNDCSPSTVVSSSALRLCGRFSVTMAMLPRSSAASEAGSAGVRRLVFLAIGSGYPNRCPKFVAQKLLSRTTNGSLAGSSRPGQARGLQYLEHLDPDLLVGPGAMADRQDTVKPG